jgi:hypothetical protein
VVSPTPSASAAPSPPQQTGGGKHQHENRSQVGKTRGEDTRGPDGTQAGEPLHQVASDAADSGGSGSGLPGWVAPLAIAVLFAGAGTIALLRRKSSGDA